MRNEDDRAQALRDMGAEVVVGNLFDLDSMHRVIAGSEAMYFGMSVSHACLAATVNVAAVAKHHAVKAFINMSQMTLSQMSITETTASPQHKLADRQRDRMSDDVQKLTGKEPLSMQEFVRKNAETFTASARTARVSVAVKPRGSDTWMKAE